MAVHVLAQSPAARQQRRGGHLAIDFVNTVAWRGDDARTTDVLGHYTDLVAWAWRAELLSSEVADALLNSAAAEPQAARSALRNAQRLRESLYEFVVEPAARSAALDTITAGYRSAIRTRELGVTGDGVRWTDVALACATPVSRIAVETVALLTTVPLSSIKQCSDAECGWLFVDHSRRQDRKWCSSSDCGNRARARRHYRHKVQEG
jgi:predicted RNA-binding Zn ribbon-like protein